MSYRQNTGGGVIAVQAASTGQTLITSALVNGASFGGITLTTGDLVLLKDQTLATENGIYTVAASGAAARSAKMQTASDAYGAQVSVRAGQSATLTYTQTGNPAIVGTGGLVFAPLGLGVLPENGQMIYTGAAITPAAGNTGSSTATDFMTFTLPSAGVWDVRYVVRSQANSAGNSTSGIQAAVYTSANALVAGTEILCAFIDSNVASTMAVAGTGTGEAQITTTGAATYKVRIWNTNGSGLSAASSSGNGRSLVSWTKIGGQAPNSGQMVDTLYVSRSGSAQTQAANWTSKDIIFNTIGAGSTIPFNTVTGVATLTAGKTYNIRAGLAWAAGGSYIISWGLFDAVTNLQLSQAVEQIQVQRSTDYIGSSNLDYTYTPTTNQTVKIRTLPATNMLSGETLRADYNTFLAIMQVGSTAYSGVNILGTPTLGQVPTAQANGTSATWQTPGAVVNTSVDNFSGGIIAGTYSVGNPMSLALVGGNLPLTSNSVVLAAGRTYVLSAGVTRLNGSGGSSEFTYCWRDLTNGVYLGAEGSITQNLNLGAGGSATAQVTPIVPITVQLWCLKNINGSAIGTNNSGTGSGYAGYANIQQLGSSAYSGVAIAGTSTVGQPLLATAAGAAFGDFTGGVTSAAGVLTVVTNANTTGAVTSAGNVTSLTATSAVDATTTIRTVSNGTGSLTNSLNLTTVVGASYRHVVSLQTQARPALMTPQADANLSTLYAAVTAITAPALSTPAAIGTVTLAPGVYDFGTAAVTLTGTLTLTGTVTDVWVFRTSGTFTTTAGNSIITMGGAATSANVFWQIGNNAPSFGANTTFRGTLLNTAAIAVGANCLVDGHLFTTAGAVSVGVGAQLLVTTGTTTAAPMGVLSSFVAYTSTGASSTTSTAQSIGDVGSGSTTPTAWAIDGLSGNVYGPGDMAFRATFTLFNGTQVASSARTVEVFRSVSLPVSLEAMYVATNALAYVQAKVLVGSLLSTDKYASVIRLS